ncbi:MAG: PAS domain S-box protein [Desulfosarcinaceae bacterium]
MDSHDSAAGPDQEEREESPRGRGGVARAAGLRHSAQHFKENILKSSSSAIATCDFDGKVSYANPAFLNMWGFEKTDEFLGRPFWQFWLIEDRLDEVMQALKNCGAWYDEIEARRKDGSVFHVQVSASVVADSKGDPIALTSTSIDITERKRTERAIVESERKLRLAIHTAGLAIWDWDIQKDIVVWHNSWPDMGGDHLQEEHGRGWWAGRIHPDDRQAVLSIFDKALIDAAESVAMEYRFQCMDGGWLNIYDRATILHDGSGRARRVIGAMMDVTHLRQMESELRLSGERFRNLANSMPQLVWTAHPDGKVDYYNERYKQYKGIERACDGSYNWGPVLHEEDMGPTTAAWKHSIHTGGAYQIEHRVLHADGKYRWHLSRALPVRDASGKITKWFGTSTDIDDLRQAEASLRQLNENLEKQISERTELAEARAKQLQSLAVELLEAEESERRRIAQLLHDDLQQLLAGARMQLQTACAGLPENPWLENVNKLLMESIKKTRYLSHELGPAVLHHSGLVAALKWLTSQMREQFDLNVVLDVGADQTNFDPFTNFLFRTARELLFNVVKHAGQKTAWVNISTDNGSVSISVSDKGKGFEPETKLHALEGSGFGLMMIRERANYLGGDFMIESSPGKGSRLTLRLPFSDGKITPRKSPARPPAGPSGRRPRPGEANRSGKGVRVLFADDHKLIRHGLIKLIAHQPDIIVVGEAGDGREAIEKARLLKPDVVIMDISMPKIDGIAATRTIKAEMPGVRVVGMSMYEEDEIKDTMREAGADSMVSKTASSAELLKAIYAIVQS